MKLKEEMAIKERLKDKCQKDSSEGKLLFAKFVYVAIFMIIKFSGCLFISLQYIHVKYSLNLV